MSHRWGLRILEHVHGGIHRGKFACSFLKRDGGRWGGKGERGGKRKCRKKKKTKEQQVPAKVNGGRNRPRSHFKFVFPWWNCRDPGMELVLSLGREFRTRRETARGRGCRRGGQTLLLADKRNISRLRPPIKTLFIGNCKKQSWKGTEKYSDLWSPGSSGFH